MDLLLKICKVCEAEKISLDFKKYRRVCRKCDSKINYEAYKDKFKEYYIKDQAHRIEYQREYLKKKKENTIRNPVGRPKTVKVEIVV